MVGALAASAVMVFGVGSSQAASQTFNVIFDLRRPEHQRPDVRHSRSTEHAHDDRGGRRRERRAQRARQPVRIPALQRGCAPGVPVTVNFSVVYLFLRGPDLGNRRDHHKPSTYHTNVQALGGNCQLVRRPGVQHWARKSVQRRSIHGEREPDRSASPTGSCRPVGRRAASRRTRMLSAPRPTASSGAPGRSRWATAST